jgi:myo-inositol-1(or 4)-monophosphatase
MIAAARKAARPIRRDFGEVEQLQVSRKGPADFVTATDHKVEEILLEELSAARPGYGFLMEERGAIEGTDKSHRFIVDPIDGTLNFMHAIPHFAISIGVERDGELVGGVIYNPISDDIFTAEKGKGAFHNDRRMRVSARKGLTDATIATGTPFKGKPGHARFLKELHKMMAQVAGIRRFGAASLDLAWVGMGRFDGFWERGLKPWDVAAGMVIVREAGGFVREIDGAGGPMETGAIAAGPEAVLDPMLAALAEARA